MNTVTEVLPAEQEGENIHNLPASITPMEMLNTALSGDANPDTLEKLLALQERWEANQARKAFDAAMADLRNNMPEILKTSTVDYTHNGKRTNYKHEDPAQITTALSPVMADVGLSFRWRTDSSAKNDIKVTCVIAHRDGHSEETSLNAAPDTGAGKNNIQSMGSTVTYLQRYTLKAAIGIAAGHDDDGAGGKREPTANNKPVEQESGREWLTEILEAGTKEALAKIRDEAIEERKARHLGDERWKPILAAFAGKLKDFERAGPGGDNGTA